MSGASDATVAVIGGGWAGMAAAVTLADAGVAVTVFEAAATLGGRARGLEKNGTSLDNGQHLLLGAYRATLSLIRHVQPDVQPRTLYTRLPLAIVGPGPFQLQAWRLPAPLHMLAGLLTTRDCTWGERLALVRAFTRWRQRAWRCDPGTTVRQLLDGEPAALNARLWVPLCLAALNTPPEAASGQVFLNVLRDGLAGARGDSDLVIPVANLSRMFPEPAAAHVVARGGTIRRNAAVRALRYDAADGGKIRLALSSSIQRFDKVIVAAAPWQALRLLGELAGTDSLRARIAAYSYQPITTVYLAYRGRFRAPARMLQLAGAPGQWMFDRSGDVGAGTLLAVVISADGPHRLLSHEALCRTVTLQLRESLPRLDDPMAPLWTRVITERRATHACTPGSERPTAGRIVPGVYLAGDHTDAEYPATLEAAVRSGMRAANALLQDV